MVLASDDLSVCVWNAADGKLLKVLKQFDSPTDFIAFSTDGRWMVTLFGFGRAAHVWDTSTWKRLAILKSHEDRLTSAAFSPDGALLLTGSLDKTAVLWDTKKERILALHQGHTGPVTQVAFDGKRVATLSADGTARIWPVDLQPFFQQRKPRELTPAERERYEISLLPQARPPSR